MQSLAFLWRGRWLIAGIAVLCAAAGVFYAEQRGTIWRARSVLYVQRKSSLMPGNDVSMWLESRNYANSQAPLLRSTPILQQSLATIGPSPIFEDSRNHMAWIRNRLGVSVGAQDDLITVTLDSEMIDQACDLVNAVVDSYLKFHADSKRHTSTHLLEHMTGELTRFENELRAIERQKLEFLVANPGVAQSVEVAGVMADRMRELRNAMTRSDVEALEAEVAWRTAKSLAGSAETAGQLSILDPRLAMPSPLAEDLKRLQEQRRQMLATATPEHPEVVKLTALIEELQRTAAANDARTAAAFVDMLEQRHLALKNKAAALAARVAEEELRFHAVNPAQAEYRSLERREEQARKSALLLYDSVRSLDMSERVDATAEVELHALVYERATPEGAAVVSSKRTLVAIAGFFGVILGVGLAWLRSLSDQRLRTPDEVAAQTPVLATLARLSPSRRSILENWNKSGGFGDAMRALRTVIWFGVRSERNRVLQVTSPEDRDGVALITAGLGIAMAQAGDRTLIVDADLEHGAQSGLFDVHSQIGLVQVLRERALAASAIVQTAVTNLHLLPAGALVNEAGELFDSDELAVMLQHLAKSYDRILIDSPPLLHGAAARIIATACDDSLLVLRAGRSTSPQLKTALGIVASVGSRVVGSVLTDSSASTSIGVRGGIHALRQRPLSRNGDALDVAARDNDSGKEARTPR